MTDEQRKALAFLSSTTMPLELSADGKRIAGMGLIGAARFDMWTGNEAGARALLAGAEGLLSE